MASFRTQAFPSFRAIHIGALYVPHFNRVLDVAPVGLVEWLMVAAIAASSIVVMEGYERLANGLRDSVSAQPDSRRPG